MKAVIIKNMDLQSKGLIMLFCFLISTISLQADGAYVFEESADSVVSMEAEHFFDCHATDGLEWKVLPHYGKTLSAVTILPTTINPSGSNLVYRMKINSKVSQVKVHVFMAPTLNFDGHDGLFYNISFDSELPVKVNVNGGVSEWQISNWQKNRINIKTTTLTLPVKADKSHNLIFAPLNAGIVIEKIVVDCGGLRYSYLGPPESEFIKVKK